MVFQRILSQMLRHLSRFPGTRCVTNGVEFSSLEGLSSSIEPSSPSGRRVGRFLEEWWTHLTNGRQARQRLAAETHVDVLECRCLLAAVDFDQNDVDFRAIFNETPERFAPTGSVGSVQFQNEMFRNVVSIESRDSTGRARRSGSGLLIGPRTVLTAAHVAEESPGKLWNTFDVFIHRDGNFKPMVAHAGEAGSPVIVHPDWHDNGDGNHDLAEIRHDLALMFLDRDLGWDIGSSGFLNFVPSKEESNDQLFVAGYPAIHPDGRGHFSWQMKDRAAITSVSNGIITTSFSGTPGQSGGPLMVIDYENLEDSGNYAPSVFGVLSGAARVDDPAKFSTVTYFTQITDTKYDWIESEMERVGDRAPDFADLVDYDRYFNFPQRDVLVDPVTNKPVTKVVPGDTVRLNVGIMNIGTRAAKDFDITVYASVNHLVDASDLPLRTFRVTRAVQPVSGRPSRNVLFQGIDIVIPENMPSLSSLVWRIDSRGVPINGANGLNPGEIVESPPTPGLNSDFYGDERTNDGYHATRLIRGSRDLHAGSVSTVSTSDAGKNVKVRLFIVNDPIDAVPLQRGFDIRLRMSDRRTSEGFVLTLANGSTIHRIPGIDGSLTVELDVQLPDPTSPLWSGNGEYLIWPEIDVRNEVNETNSFGSTREENNNIVGAGFSSLSGFKRYVEWTSLNVTGIPNRKPLVLGVTATNTLSFSVPQSSLAGTRAGFVFGVDLDRRQTLSYSISEGNGDNAFQIDRRNGAITLARAGVLQPGSPRDLRVVVTDDGTTPESVTCIARISATVPARLLEIRPGAESGVERLESVEANGLVYFNGNDGDTGQELWRSDGTPSGTFRIADINSGSGSSAPESFSNVNGVIYFVASDGQNPEGLWRSDGSVAGTSRIGGPSNPQFLTNVNGKLYFTAFDLEHGQELWTSDGTTDGTRLVKDIFPGEDSTILTEMTTIAGTLFFVADDGTNGYQIWKSDGTSDGTVRITTLSQLTNRPTKLTAAGNVLYFTTFSNNTGNELWKSDGTTDGTMLVKDIFPGTNGSQPTYLTNVSGTLFFAADNGVTGKELWKSNGTPESTVLVKDIQGFAPFAGVFGNSNPRYLSNAGGTLYFRADNGFDGPQIWKSDGTDVGTIVQTSLNPAANPRTLHSVGSNLSFVADAAGTVEIWKVTPESAFPMAQVGSAPFNPISAGSRLFFNRVDPGTGFELWVADLNSAPRVTSAIFGVDENSPNGTVVGQVAASDLDSSQHLSYQISGGNDNNAFTIDAETGVVAVFDSSLLDFETTSSFVLQVTVTDGGTPVESGTAEISINLLDVNEVPIVANQEFSLAENSGAGTVVGIMGVADEDPGQVSRFSIVGGNPGNAFQIDSSTGAISIANAGTINFESQPEWSLVIAATDDGDGELSGTGVATIRMQDLNEVPIVHDEVFSLAEQSPQGTVVGLVEASDPDPNTSLRYSLTSGNNQGAFAINPATGLLRVANAEALLFGTTPEFTLVVSVSDQSAPAATSNSTVKVKLQPIRVIDDVDAGFELTGSWQEVAKGLGGRARNATGTDKKAVWRFQGLEPGRYRVSATWQVSGGLNPAAEYVVRTGAIEEIVATRKLDQRTKPDSRVSGGASWEDIATVDISGTSISVGLQAGSTTTQADAIRIERIGALPEIEVTVDGSVLANGDDRDLGVFAVGESGPVLFTVKNTGLADLVLDAGSLSGLRFQTSSQLPGVLIPGQSTSVVAYVDTSLEADVVGRFELTTNVSGMRRFTAGLRARIEHAASFLLTTSTGEIQQAGEESEFIFDTRSFATPVANRFTLTNHGTKQLNLTNARLTGTGFSIVGSFPDAVLPGASADFVIRADATIPGVYTATLEVQNDALNSSPLIMSLTSTVVNLPPTLDVIPDVGPILEDAASRQISLTGISAGENESQAISITTASSNPALIKAPVVTYTSPNSSGKLTFKPEQNKFGESVITVTVQDTGTDGIKGSADDRSIIRTFRITVSPVNDPPASLALSNLSVVENKLAGTTVGTFTSTDVDSGTPFTYSLVTGPGNTDNALFAISGSSLKTKSVIDYELKKTCSIRVRATDAGGAFLEKVFTIIVFNQLDGTSGSDVFVLRYSTTSVTVSMAVNSGVAIGQGTFGLISPVSLLGLGVNDVVKLVGTSGEDTIQLSAVGLFMNGHRVNSGGLASLILAGAAANDLYRIDADDALGSVTLDESGGGTDTIDFSLTTTAAVTLNLGSITSQTVNGNLALKLNASSSFENITGGSGNDILQGNHLANILTGNAGHDSLTGRAGNDSVSGGLGDDTYVFGVAAKAETDTVTEAANAGTDTLDFSALTTTVNVNLGSTAVRTVHTNRTIKLNSAATFENAVGGSRDDILVGNALANVLTGRAGNDTLHGGAGSDTLHGGDGADRLFGEAGDDVMDGGAGPGDVLDGGADQNGIVFYGTHRDDVISVGWSAGPQVVFTIGGKTTATSYTSCQTIFVFAGAGNDKVTMEESGGQRWRAEFHGQAGNDKLIGSLNNDLLIGGAGNDELSGVNGDDTYLFGVASAAEADTVTEAANSGTDTLDFSALTTSVNVNLGSTAVRTVHMNRMLKLNSATAFENAVGGSSHDILIGNTRNNTLTGSAGNDVLTGGAGNDVLVGGTGDDTYHFGVASAREADTVAEATNAGTDTLSFNTLTTDVVLNLGSNAIQRVHTNRTIKLNAVLTFENAIGGSGNDTITGNTSANVLVGNAGSDRLFGGAGRDIVIGGNGLDTLNGGTEDDVLIAGRTMSDLVFNKLVDLSTSWKSANPYPTRLTRLRASVGPSRVSLKAKVNTVNDSGENDLMTGSSGTDWFFRALDDVITDLAAGETLDVL